MKGRTYRYMSDPLFQFGYGLSYTTFSVGEVKLSKPVISKNEALDLTIPVTNTGKRNGAEVIQIYVRKLNDSDGPIKTLKGFQRVEIAPGKTSQVCINLPPSSFEFFDRNIGEMTVGSGEYEVFYGTSSNIKDLKMTIVSIK